MNNKIVIVSRDQGRIQDLTKGEACLNTFLVYLGQFSGLFKVFD